MRHRCNFDELLDVYNVFPEKLMLHLYFIEDSLMFSRRNIAGFNVEKVENMI